MDCVAEISDCTAEDLITRRLISDDDITIDVTWEDMGPPPPLGHALTDCMVARALKRKYPGRHITVGYTIAEIDGRLFHFPEWVGEKVGTFMSGRPVEPFSFTMRVRYVPSCPCY